MQKILNISTISYAEFWDRLSYYGLQSLLVLYLTKVLHLSDSNSYTLFGVYVALSYAVTVLGGILADKILGLFYGCVFGAILIVLGNIILTIPRVEFIYVGLAVMVMGIGLLKPNNPSLLGTFYKEESTERSRAFSILYLCISLGSIVGPLIYGVAIDHNSYWAAFIFSALGISSAVINYFLFRNRLNIEKATLFNFKNKLFNIILLILGCILAMIFLLNHPKIFGWVLSLGTLIFAVYFLIFLKKLNKSELFSVISLIIPVVGCIIYLISLLQIYSTITLFIDRYVDKHLFGMSIPTIWFSALEPIFLLFLLPLVDIFWAYLKKKGREPEASIKVIIGLFIAFLAFCMFSLMSKLDGSTSHGIIIVLVLVANALLAIGEIFTIPVTMSLTNMVAPYNYRSTLMGIFYFSLTFSGYLSGVFAKTIPSSNVTSASFTHLFIMMALFSLISAGILIAVKFFIQWLRLKNLKNDIS